MKTNQRTSRLRGICLAFLALTGLISCKEDMAEPPEILDEDTSTRSRATYASRSVNWNSYAHGTTYTSTMAASDFGNVTGWQSSKAFISTGQFRIKLLKNALSGAGGMVARVDIPFGTEYELQFDMKFHSQFDWSRGGKLGFGFLIGDGHTGGSDARDGKGGSARLTWYQNNENRVWLRAYLYHYDQSSNFGDVFGSYPAAPASLARSTWYTVKLYVKSNSDSNTNGHFTMDINGTTVVDRAMRWTTDNGKRRIRKISFSTFRGGSTSDWESDTDGYIYFDNLSWNRLTEF